VAPSETYTVAVRELAFSGDTLEHNTPSSVTPPACVRRASASAGESPSVTVRMPKTVVRSPAAGFANVAPLVDLSGRSPGIRSDQQRHGLVAINSVPRNPRAADIVSACPEQQEADFSDDPVDMFRVVAGRHRCDPRQGTIGTAGDVARVQARQREHEHDYGGGSKP
jgi:hypothetical protein